MIQLSFQPALDPFHAMFRFARLHGLLFSLGELSMDHVRILDFFLVFPYRIDAIRLLPAHRRFRKLAQQYQHQRPYGEQPEDAALFQRMAPMQAVAMETFASGGFYDAERLRAFWVRPTSSALPIEIAARVSELNQANGDLLEFLRVLATEYQVGGANGLKHRTGLMEHRYDVV